MNALRQHRLRPGTPLLLTLVSLGGLWLSGCAPKEVAPEPVRAVRTLKVEAGTAQLERDYAAEIKARTESRLGFRVGGKLLARPVNAATPCVPARCWRNSIRKTCAWAKKPRKPGWLRPKCNSSWPLQTSSATKTCAPKTSSVPPSWNGAKPRSRPPKRS